MARVRNRPERDDLVFTGPAGNPAGIISEADCITAGIHDGAAWNSAKFQIIATGDLMDLAGFRERVGNPRAGTRELTADELASVVKALELHTGMNYYGHGGQGGYGGIHACAACCTCF